MNINFPYAPGDVWCVTRLLRDLDEQFPDAKPRIISSHDAILENNPHQHPFDQNAESFTFRFKEPPEGKRRTFGNYRKTDNMVRVMYDAVSDFGYPVIQRTFAPEFYLYGKERNYSIVPLDKPVCIINAGFKSDIPCKFWGSENFSDVVSSLKDRVTFVQVGRMMPQLDHHSAIPGAIDLLGKTTLRELAQLVYHADYVLTGISQLHHLAGIQNYKPRHCITIAGGREPKNWADCHRRAGVTWHWIENLAPCEDCLDADPDLHDGAGCWRSDCPNGSACMESITPEQIINIIKETL